MIPAEKIKLLPPGLEYLGMDAEMSDWAVFTYNGYHIVLHLTVIGGTRARLIKDRNDPIYYHIICDWCLDNQGLLPIFYSVLLILFFIKRIDENEIENLPHSFQVNPIFNDPDFSKWWESQDYNIDEKKFANLFTLLRKNDRRTDVIKFFWIDKG